MTTKIIKMKWLRQDIDKYLHCLSYIDKIFAAQCQNDFVKMNQLAVENRPKTIHGLQMRYFKLTKQNALTIKVLLEVLRMQKQLLLIVPLLIGIAALIKFTSVLSNLPLLDIPEISQGFIVLFIAMAFNLVNVISYEQIQRLVSKRKLGLSLPLSDRQILYQFL